VEYKREELVRTLLVLFSGLLVAVAITLSLPKDPGAQEAPQRPNIINIMFDDSNANLLHTMDNAQAEIRARGVAFPNAYFATSLCCPSRATQLTGLYPHNTGVFDNASPNGGYPTFKANGHEPHTYGKWADSAGYQTAFFGKYMNEYNGSLGSQMPNPPGWDHWQATVGTPTLGRGLKDGRVVDFNPKLHDEWVADNAFGWIGAHANDESPFLSVLSFYAPHDPAEHPTSYDSEFTDAPLPKTPAFNENLADKPAFMKNNYPVVTAAEETILTDFYRDRLRSVEYVDDRLSELFSILKSTGELDNTYIILWADNSNHLGEHRAFNHTTGGKSLPHLVDARMPMWVAGPGIPAGTTIVKPVSAVDVAHTLADMADATPTRAVDGRSLLPLASGQDVPWRNYAYAEFPQGGVSAGKVPPWNALYWPTGTYHQWPTTKEKELYDLTTDPYQINNVLYGGTSTAEQAQVTKYKGIVNQMKTCVGAQCRTIEAQP
jgi:arylsulfatase A-like enzyme